MKFRRIALALAIVLALMPLTALADLSRGDRGEDVKELQKLLFETGWLFEEPDGIFGKNTEAALISFQKFMGLNANGRADSVTMQLLKQSWSDLHRTAYNNDPAYTPNPAADVCHLRIAEDGTLVMDYCSAHTELLAEEADLLARDTVEDARAACALWEADIESMYTRWLEVAETEDKLGVMTAYGAWKTTVQKQREALQTAWPDDPLAVERQMGILLKGQALLLCGFGVQFGGAE